MKKPQTCCQYCLHYSYKPEELMAAKMVDKCPGYSTIYITERGKTYTKRYKLEPDKDA